MCVSELHSGLVKMKIVGPSPPSPQFLIQLSLGWQQRIFISNKLPSDTDSAILKTPLGEPLF